MHGVVEVHEGQEAADAVYAWAMGKPFGRPARTSITNAMCENARILCTRDYAVLLRQKVGSYSHILDVREEEEIAEAVTRFSLKLGGGNFHGLTATERHNLASNVCSLHNKDSDTEPLLCRRKKPMALTQNFQFGTTEESKRTAVVFEDEEAVDAVVPYCIEWGIHGTDLCDQVFHSLCASAKTSALHPEYRKPSDTPTTDVDDSHVLPQMAFPFRCSRLRAIVFDKLVRVVMVG